MTSEEAGGVVDGEAVWSRRVSRLTGLLSYPLMVISLVLAAVLVDQGASTWAQYRRLAALAGLAMVLTVWFDTRAAATRSRPVVLWTYFALRWVITAVLVVGNPFFGFYAFVAYLDAMRYLAYRRAVVLIVATALLTTTSQSGGRLPTGATGIAGFALLWAFNTALVCALAWGGLVVERQNEERRAALAELTAVNRRLKEAREKNEGLHAQLVEQAREAGVLDERARLAREIHDTIAQGLTAVIAQLQATRPDEGLSDAVTPPHVDGAWRPRVQTAIDVARESLTAARRSVLALHPAELEGGDLPAALRQVTERWCAVAPSPALHLMITGSPMALSQEGEAALLRTAQEALANARRHADADVVSVRLTTTAGAVLLEVRDDGRGFDAGAPRPGGGVGLDVMRQRVELVGGCLRIDSAPTGEGTSVCAEVPLPAASPELVLAPGAAVQT